MTLNEFDEITKDCEGKIKPIFIMLTDFGPDENPRYQKVIDIGIHHFCNNDLDCFFVATSRRTIDDELERKNFQAAAGVLSQVFSNVKIDGYEVVSLAIDPQESEIPASSLIQKNELWISKHVRSAQYFLQIVKCEDDSCCKPFRSNFNNFFNDQFLPPPLSLSYNSSRNLIWGSPSISKPKFMSLFHNLNFHLKLMPYDNNCPSIQPLITIVMQYLFWI